MKTSINRRKHRPERLSAKGDGAVASSPFPKLKLRILGFAVWTGLAACLSCENPPLYDRYQVVEPEWHRDREYFFTCEIEDNTLNYDISLLIRNNGSYPYQNLWLFCSEDQPIGPARCDTFECLLADEYGKWLGRGVSVYHSRIPLYTRCHFQHKGQYTFSFRHGMRDSTLRGIEQIGMRIEAVK